MNPGESNISTATRPRSTLVVGATSSLAQALCRELAQRGHPLVLAGRDETELTLLAYDIAARFQVECGVLVTELLASNFSAVQMIAQAGQIGQLVIAAGDMGGGEQDDPDNLLHTAHINYIVPAQIATAAAKRLKELGGGQIVVITSVAGDRGRQSNYLYGSAKAALTAFASGLRNRYSGSVHVMTVKPGFIDTPMTWGMHSPLIASREYVAKKIADAMDKRKDVIYVPWFWQLIMLIIRTIPEKIFKRLKL